MLVGALMITFMVTLLVYLKYFWLSHWKYVAKLVGLDIFCSVKTCYYILFSRPTKKVNVWEVNGNKNHVIIDVNFSSHDLGASSGEVVDEVQKVECHEQEGKHEKESENDTGGSDHHIHVGAGDLVLAGRFLNLNLWWLSHWKCYSNISILLVD